MSASISMYQLYFLSLVLLWIPHSLLGFQSVSKSTPIISKIRLHTSGSISLPNSASNKLDPTIRWNFLNPLQQKLALISPAGPFYIKVKGKTLNIYGVLIAFVVFACASFTLPVMALATLFMDILGNKKTRRYNDYFVNNWARISLLLTGNQVTLFGAENLPGKDETVMYVPNHTSFLDVMVMSAFIPRPFKYLSKAEIMSIPVIGHAMKLAKHVFLKRNDLQSTMEVTELVKERMRDGNAMVLFAEGTRSPDGKLKLFKKGAFQMAKECQVKIIPVSLGNLYRYMPPSCLLPVGPVKNGYVKIHPAIETKGRTIKQIKAEVFAAVNDGLPLYQQYQPEEGGGSGSNVEND